MADAPKPPKPPKFYPIDIPKTLQQAMEYDIQGYDMSDADFAQRFPGLVAGKRADMEEAFQQLTGPLDPVLQGEFARSGLSAGLNAVGGGNAMAGLALEEGAFGTNTAAASVARSTQEKQDYDRQYFDSLIAGNPQRGFGLSGADVANLNIANTGGLNASNQQAYAGQVQGAIAQGQANVQTAQMITGLITSLAGIYAANAK